jgi:sialate O-acetylesterase
MKKIIELLLLLLIEFSMFSQNLFLPSIFSDKMVMQQNSSVPIWGKASPNSEITINTSWSGQNVTIKSDGKGNWKTYINTLSAGGPYSINIKNNDEVIIIKDILFGEVWICSGQSNMEMPLSGWRPNDTIEGSDNEIKNADFPNIRMFTVQRAYSLSPLYNCKGEWAICSPENAGNFSATAFFFGKKLYKELNIPIGLIHTSWGGTVAEAWADENSLNNMPDFADIINNLPALKEESDLYMDWLYKHNKVIPPNLPSNEKWMNLYFNDSVCSSAIFDDSYWKSMNLPVLWERTEVGEIDGVVWFRKKIEIPEQWIGKNLELNLAMIDDMDATWVNGVKIAATEKPGQWQVHRKYIIPSNIINSRDITIAVRVIDNQGGGGIWGQKENMFIKCLESNTDEKINIAGEWKYLPVAIYYGGIFYLLDITNQEFNCRPKLKLPIGENTPTVLFNAMINPLVPYTIKGAIWYQGEANVGRANQYTKLFPLMIQSWRKNWGYDFPFYYVQIAPYEYSGADNIESAALRDAQWRCMKTQKTGMVVTLDIGNVKNIHPAYKKAVGERLALWALAKDYNKPVTFSGPLFKSIEIKNDKAYLTFEQTGKGLILKGNISYFEIAGTNQIFLPAKAKIENNKIVVWNENVKKPLYVRYSYKNGSGASLFNSEGLPAPTFSTESEIKE